MTDTKGPTVRQNETPAYFDVDETLILKGPQDAEYYIDLNYYGVIKRAKPIKQHVDFLKSCKARGYEVTVWSANGWQWAYEVVTKLGLLEYVDYVCTKPQFYVDDKQADKWTKQVFITGEYE